MDQPSGCAEKRYCLRPKAFRRSILNELSSDTCARSRVFGVIASLKTETQRLNEALNQVREETATFGREVASCRNRLSEAQQRIADLKNTAKLWEKIAIARETETKQLRNRIQELYDEDRLTDSLGHLSAEPKTRHPLTSMPIQNICSNTRSREKSGQLKNIRESLNKRFEEMKVDIATKTFVVPPTSIATQTPSRHRVHDSVESELIPTQTQNIQALLQLEEETDDLRATSTRIVNTRVSTLEKALTASPDTPDMVAGRICKDPRQKSHISRRCDSGRTALTPSVNWDVYREVLSTDWISKRGETSSDEQSSTSCDSAQHREGYQQDIEEIDDAECRLIQHDDLLSEEEAHLTSCNASTKQLSQKENIRPAVSRNGDALQPVDFIPGRYSAEVTRIRKKACRSFRSLTSSIFSRESTQTRPGMKIRSQRKIETHHPSYSRNQISSRSGVTPELDPSEELDHLMNESLRIARSYKVEALEQERRSAKYMKYLDNASGEENTTTVWYSLSEAPDTASS